MKEPVPEFTGTMSRAGAFKQGAVQSPPWGDGGCPHGN